ncbi:DNA polymerase III subunit gamma/tau [Candidatus Uhrbacteria bacterium]|nr:DNA polymerase III subunit gamma/tau [Candidatus Uhrbacteria bacterium]
MALALYRKYRPQLFSAITGQAHVKNTLAREVATGKIAHAYLFSGTRGTGKTSTARIFAKAINCVRRKADDSEPCNACDICKLITAGRSLDILEIDAASHTGVENVREVIIETAKFAPAQAHYKVFIIDEAHMLTNSAWNALLKIMEEPPAHVVFILATTEIHKVPDTILSRCQRFDFHRVDAGDLTGLLKSIAEAEKFKVEESVLANIARLSEGCVRDAEGLLEQILSLGEKKINTEIASLVLPRSFVDDALVFFEFISANQVREGFLHISKVREESIELEQFLLEFLELVRLVLFLQAVGQAHALANFSSADQKRISTLAQTVPLKKLLAIVDVFGKSWLNLKVARIPTLPLEVALLEICGGEESAAPPPSHSGQKPHSSGPASRTELDARPRSSTSGGNHARSASATLLPQNAMAEVPLVEIMKMVSLADVQEKWPDLLKAVQSENHSLSFLLMTGAPIAVNGNMVQIGVQYPFHCDKLNEPKCRAVLENVLQSLMTAPVKVEAVLSKAAGSTAPAVDDVLRTLGGRVVE